MKENIEKKYVPISCDFYDEIELLALRGSQCTIVFRASDDTSLTLDGIIHNVYSKNKEEFLDMKGGEKIRLDRLISINGMMLPDSCGI